MLAVCVSAAPDGAAAAAQGLVSLQEPVLESSIELPAALLARPLAVPCGPDAAATGALYVHPNLSVSELR